MALAVERALDIIRIRERPLHRFTSPENTGRSACADDANIVSHMRPGRMHVAVPVAD